MTDLCTLYKLIFTPQFWQPDTIYHFHFHFHFDLQCETYSDLYKLVWLLEQNISNLAEENQLISVKYICDIMTLCCDIIKSLNYDIVTSMRTIVLAQANFYNLNI